MSFFPESHFDKIIHSAVHVQTIIVLLLLQSDVFLLFASTSVINNVRDKWIMQQQFR